MKVKKGDYVIFLSGKETRQGIVLNIAMGMYEIMAKDGMYEARASEIIDNKGNVFELMEK